MASAAAEAAKGGAQRSVVILPGLGNNAKDYEGLAGLLRDRGLHVEVPLLASCFIHHLAAVQPASC